jgi:micrococcal nuclease
MVRIATGLASAALALVTVLVGGCGPNDRSERFAAALTTTTAPDGAATVARVIDGDTILVVVGGHEERVRLIGIDTPETKDPRRPVQCFGSEAAARTAALLPAGTPVRLVRDVELRDRYDRLLAYVHRADDDLFVNLTLAREGYAAAATYPPNVAHSEAITAAAARAREERRGLWGACDGADQPVDG